MKKIALLASALILFWSCDSTPGGNKDVMPETYQTAEHGHHDAEKDGHGEEGAKHGEEANAEAHIDEGNDQVFDLTPNIAFEFTAFKTPEKIGVKGKFADINVSGYSTGTTIADKLKGAKARIVTQSIKTGDDARDNTLRNEFFAKLTGETITAEIVEIQENKAEIAINLNGKEATKTFDFFVSDDNPNKAVLKGSIDMLTDFSANTAYESIALACKALHADKTWTDVDLEVQVEF